MRVILVVGAALTFGAGVQLVVLSTLTDRWFAWTIGLPLAAAVIGSFYFGASLLSAWSAQREDWEGARIGVASVQVFLWVTGIATLVHVSSFHLDSEILTARVAAWIWVVVYVVEPPVLAVIYALQVRATRRAPKSTARDALPLALRVLLVVTGSVTAAMGVLLVVAPEFADSIWAWDLTPLVSRATGAWLLGFGGVQVETAIDATPRNIRPALWAQVLVGALLLTTFARWPEDVRLDSVAGGGAVAWGILVVVLAAWGLLRARPRTSGVADNIHPTRPGMP